MASEARALAFVDVHTARQATGENVLDTAGFNDDECTEAAPRDQCDVEPVHLAIGHVAGLADSQAHDSEAH